jgi:hypothetical protein
MYIIELIAERANDFSINRITKLIEDIICDYFFKNRLDLNEYCNEN